MEVSSLPCKSTMYVLGDERKNGPGWEETTTFMKTLDHFHFRPRDPARDGSKFTQCSNMNYLAQL